MSNYTKYYKKKGEKKIYHANFIDQRPNGKSGYIIRFEPYGSMTEEQFDEFIKDYEEVKQ